MSGGRSRACLASINSVLRDVAQEALNAWTAGLQAVLLFGIPSSKDDKASAAYARDGVVPKAVRAIKKECPDIAVMTDVCLCEYTSHGHCGITKGDAADFQVLNDETVELLGRSALAHAEAGADMVAPSDMMDGRVGAIREALDQAGFAIPGS